jgi:hydroxyethylthiazole kinase-like uncharacterized protein yjeF
MGIRRITLGDCEPLHSVAATREIERAAAAGQPPFSLMARAGLSVARLSLALAPHAQRIWIACGPGNNGGDGLVAAMHLMQHSLNNGGRPAIGVTLAGEVSRLPADAAEALQLARQSGVTLLHHPPADWDFAIDALLGIGASRPAIGVLAEHLALIRMSRAPVLSVDLPSGLLGDTGVCLGLHAAPPGERHTLSLLTIKPGLFTADGRDPSGCVWFDDLGVDSTQRTAPIALLNSTAETARPVRAHATHKGSFGDVLVIGGQDITHSGSGMTGAAVLAARAALRGGAGRVYLALLSGEGEGPSWDPVCPELMLRRLDRVLDSDLLQTASVACGCGGGAAVAPHLPRILSRAHTLVLDADALNAIAEDGALQSLLQQRFSRAWTTVLTPHPLEAARLLGTDTADVMADRLACAQALAERFQSIVVLKGSGSVIAAPTSTPMINASGNPALATAGTGDVLAGMIATALAQTATGGATAMQGVAGAVHRHGWLADQWAAGNGGERLTADGLARRA